MGKTGKTVYPKMFNLDSPFNMESNRLKNLRKKGNTVAAEHSEEFDSCKQPVLS